MPSARKRTGLTIAPLGLMNNFRECLSSLASTTLI